MPTQVKNGSANLKDVKHDIATLRQDVASLTKSFGSDVKTSVQENAAQAREYSTEKYEQLQDGVRKKPMVSVGIAFGAGLLVSALLKSRGK